MKEEMVVLFFIRNPTAQVIFLCLYYFVGYAGDLQFKTFF